MSGDWAKRKVVVAASIPAADHFARALGLPPRGRDVVLVSTGSAHGADKIRGLTVLEDHVIEHVGASTGLYYDSYRRAIAVAIVPF